MCEKTTRLEKATWVEDHWEILPIIFEEAEDVPFPEVGTNYEKN